ncbi:MAG: hypothetical protein WBA76_16820 [Phormidesmis sp.]
MASASALLAQRLESDLPDVALIDMRMPVMDGVATAAALRDRTQVALLAQST